MKFARSLILSSALVCGLHGVAFSAEREGVVVSIKPLHSLVAAVMDGVAEPKLIVQGAGSEHVYSLKPSDAKAIEGAKVIFWAGPTMETFLDKSIDTLGEGADVVALSDTDGLNKLKFREGGPFETHDHGAEEEHGHDHEEGHEHKHSDAGGAEEHSHSHEEESSAHNHEHGEYDLHFWLDPENGKILVKRIADVLSKNDPEHAAQFKKNAEDYAKKLDSLTTEISKELEPVKDKPFIVFHDAYQYFENRFGVEAVGSITVSPENAPGASRLTEIKKKIEGLGTACVFSEPQFEPKLVQTVIDGTKAKTGVLDPLGAELKEGPNLYPELIQNLARSLKSCLSD